MFESVSPDEIDFLRLMLKCDANLSQEQKHASTKLAKKDFTDYVENIAKLRQMLSIMESDPKRKKADADLVEYRNRLNYLDKTLTKLEVDNAPVIPEVSMIPPPIDNAPIPDEAPAATGGCIFKKAARPPTESTPATTGGCIFKKASPPATENESSGVCPVSGVKKGEMPPLPTTTDEEDMWKKAESMGGCPMFQASAEESEKMRKEAAQGLESMNKSKCPMTGADSNGKGCPMAKEGDHPELEGTWMEPVSDDPDACPTFLPRPLIDVPKHVKNVKTVKDKKIMADQGLGILEEAEKEVLANLESTLGKIKNGEFTNEQKEEQYPAQEEDMTQEVIQTKSECPVHQAQNLFFAHIQTLWTATAVLVFAFLAGKLLIN